MRDPARIDRMLAVLKDYWHRYPDLRLGQIISNMTPDHQDIFYIEDEPIEAALRKMLADPAAVEPRIGGQVHPQNCAVRERTADGVSVGRCWFALNDETCPRHGDVSEVMKVFRTTGRLSEEPKR